MTSSDLGLADPDITNEPDPHARAGRDPEASAWLPVLEAYRRGAPIPVTALSPVFAPLFRHRDKAIAAGRALIVGQLGQSLDGRIAARNGESRYINAQCGLRHLHRLRALADAVVVGVATVNADNPRLTVRLTDGPDPDRVIIDPNMRARADAKLFDCPRAKTLRLTAALIHAGSGARNGATAGNISPEDIAAWLFRQRYQTVLIEGGAATLSRFIAAGALDRLHLITAPVILGGGTPALDIPGLNGLSDALHPDISVHRIGRDLLIDCDLTGEPQRA